MCPLRQMNVTLASMARSNASIKPMKKNSIAYAVTPPKRISDGLSRAGCRITTIPACIWDWTAKAPSSPFRLSPIRPHQRTEVLPMLTIWTKFRPKLKPNCSSPCVPWWRVLFFGWGSWIKPLSLHLQRMMKNEYFGLECCIDRLNIKNNSTASSPRSPRKLFSSGRI